jgi:hypothetical protein
VHADNWDGNYSSSQDLRIQLSEDSENRINGCVFGGMNTGGKAKSWTVGIAMNDDERDLNRADCSFTDRKEGASDLASLGFDGLDFKGRTRWHQLVSFLIFFILANSKQERLTENLIMN